MIVIDSIYFSGHRCFKNDWAGFGSIKAINVIIGRNNTGKSHLLDLVRVLCNGSQFRMPGWKYRCHASLDHASLRRYFLEHSSVSDLRGNPWHDHGAHLVGALVEWEIDQSCDVSAIKISETTLPKPFNWQFGEAARLERIGGILKDFTHPLVGSEFRRLLADRDIRAEIPDVHLRLESDGRGASNIIRRYIVSSNASYPREIIQKDLLAALNDIFGNDGRFTEIQVKLHDESAGGKPEGHWEIFLGEDKKGLVPLSNSGSGLKTVLLVLLNLLVVPRIEGGERSKFVFAFEELENNLHPSLLRRLLQYLEKYAVDEGAKIFLTTHSSTALDLFGVSSNAQIIHVTHDGEAARSVVVSAHFDQLGVISELGAKPSDLLQANGIIWVEGPSDCIYINRWLDLYSDGRLREGRDYQCAFYGGSLLARTQFTSPEKAEAELVNLFRVNSNVIVICDGDRSGPQTRIKDRVRRIRAEVAKIPDAHCWVTNAREIENYIPGTVLEKALGVSSMPDPTQYEQFFPRKGSPGSSYIEAKLNRKGLDKMELAVLSSRYIDRQMMEKRFEWKTQMQQIVARIDSWNL